LKLEFIIFDCRIDFYVQIINFIKITYFHRTTKYTHRQLLDKWSLEIWGHKVDLFMHVSIDYEIDQITMIWTKFTF